MEQMNFFLSFFWRMPIEKPEIYEAYASIDAWCEGRGVSMGKNDLLDSSGDTSFSSPPSDDR